MGYIGNTPADKFLTLAKQNFSTSATTSYTLDSAVSSTQDIALFINNVRQSPVDAYSVSGTALTLTSATASSDEMYCVYLGKTVGTVSPASDSVTTAMLQANAVTTAKITDGNITGAKFNADVISGQTELAAEPADTDEFLVSDAGVIKRVDYSHIKGGGGLVFINQVSSTSEVSNLTLDNVFTSTYTNYLIVGEYTLINGSGPEARILFRTGGSSGSDLTASEYNYHFIRANADGDSLGVNRATGAASCNFTGSTDEDSARVGVRITWTVYDPFDSSVRTTVSGHGKFTQTNGDGAATIGFCDYKGTDSITGIKFYASSDNVKNGHFRVYGIVDS